MQFEKKNGKEGWFHDSIFGNLEELNGIQGKVLKKVGIELMVDQKLVMITK